MPRRKPEPTITPAPNGAGSLVSAPSLPLLPIRLMDDWGHALDLGVYAMHQDAVKAIAPRLVPEGQGRTCCVIRDDHGWLVLTHKLAQEG